MTGRQGVEARTLAVGLVLTVVLCLVLVPILGQRGAALGTLVALIANNVLRAIVVRRVVGIRVFDPRVLAPVLVALALAGAVRAASHAYDPRTFPSTALLALIALGLYAAAAWRLFLNDEERAAALSAAKGAR